MMFSNRFNKLGLVLTVLLILMIKCDYCLAQTPLVLTDLIEKAKGGDDEAIVKLLTDYKILDIINPEDKAFYANIKALKLRTYYIMRGQYYDLLNGFWGGQNPGFVDTVKEISLCKKKIDLLAIIPYENTEFIDGYILDMLMVEREFAKSIQQLRGSVKSKIGDVVLGYLTIPDWIDPNITNTEEEYERAIENNRKVNPARLDVLGDFTMLMGTTYAAKEVDQYYKDKQFKFLEGLRSEFGEELGTLYKLEHRRFCNQEYGAQVYDTWFQKEYLEVSDGYFSEYRFENYFDTKNYIGAYRLWIDSNTKDIGNMMTQIINSGRYYALKMALKRGVSPKTANTNGENAYQVLTKQGQGAIQSKMSNLLSEYAKDPQSFVIGIPEVDIMSLRTSNSSFPDFDNPKAIITGYKVLEPTNGPYLKQGVMTHIRANGKVFLGTFAGNSGILGINGFDRYSIFPQFKHGALLYRIGADDKWKLLGSELSFKPKESGTIQFVVNDKDTRNNSLGYNVEILTERAKEINPKKEIQKTRPVSTQKKAPSASSTAADEKRKAQQEAYLKSISKKQESKSYTRSGNPMSFVIFSDGYTSNVKIKKGQDVHIKAYGSMFLGDKPGRSAPGGIKGFEEDKLQEDLPFGALCVRVGKSDKWKKLGSNIYFVSETDGVLEFMINDSDVSDNEGQHSVTIKSINKFTHVD